MPRASGLPAWARTALAVALVLAPAAASAERCSADRPPALWGAAVAYDSERDRMLLFGGALAPREFAGETWSWQETGWRCHDVPGPPARAFAGVAFHPETRRVIVHGGRGEGNVTLGDTWEWDGAGWRELTPEGPGVDHHAMAWSVPDRKLMLFGGWNGERVVADTWLWDGQAWGRVEVTGPPPRSAFAMASDPPRRRVVVHGGLWIEGQYADAWAWDGSAWEPLWGPYDASSVDHHAMIFDRALDRLLIFGGKNYRYQPLDRTATLGPSTLEPLDVSGPPPRHSVAFAYDPERRRGVLYGGKVYRGDEQVALDDLWLWREGRWTLWQAPSTP